MILDSVQDFANYTSLHPLFPKALEYIMSLDFNNLPFGKFDIDGKNLFAIISNSDLKQQMNAKLEAHNDYIDIQIPVSKTERFGWSPRKTLVKEVGSFDTSKDIIFYEDIPKTYIDVTPLSFVIFYPHDAHAPCIGELSVIKIVIKVKS